MKRLATVDQLPEEADAYRNAILRGLALGDKGGEHAVALLEWWSGERPSEEGDDIAKKLKAWQTWYADKYPDRPAAELPTPPEGNKYTVEELIKHLASDEGKTGNLEKGSAVFAKVQCAKCHRLGERGERMGPDLTNLSKRFMRKEILESILFPSHVISDQYASKTVVTTDGKTYTGIVGAGAAGETVILQADGKKIALLNEQIEETQPSKLSAMPEGLINELTLEEISDLFTYLGVLQPTPIAEKENQTKVR
jgi:putative heme-binding domain-containing protein